MTLQEPPIMTTRPLGWVKNICSWMNIYQITIKKLTPNKRCQSFSKKIKYSWKKLCHNHEWAHLKELHRFHEWIWPGVVHGAQINYPEKRYAKWNLIIADATELICHALPISEFQILIMSCPTESRNDPSAKSEVLHDRKLILSLKISFLIHVWLAQVDRHQTKPLMVSCEFKWWRF